MAEPKSRFRWSTRAPLAALALAAFVLLDPPGAQAATFTVNSTIDAVDANPGNGVCATSGGACTLRAAIMEANALAGDDVITLPAGTYTLTLGPLDDEQSGTNDVDASGDLDILNKANVADNDLTINGAGAGSTIVDGNDLDRVFDIDPGQFGFGGGHAIDATFTNLTVRGGHAHVNAFDDAGTGNNPKGGGIRYDGYNEDTEGALGSLTLTNVVVTGNTADHSGGGVMFEYGTLTITGSTITNNLAKAGEGGGVWTGNAPQGSTTIANTTISGNTAAHDRTYPNLTAFPETAGGDGGGIKFNTGVSATVTNVTISNNRAERNGGGLHTTNKAFTMSSSTVTGNRAGQHGGGIFSDADHTQGSPTPFSTFTNVTVQSNVADATTSGLSTADGTGNGGGIMHRGGKLDLSGSTIGGSGVGNSAVNGGGLGFDNDPARSVSATSDIRKNQFLSNAASGQGGGWWFDGGTFTATLNRLRANSAPTGRGLHRVSGTLNATRNWWGCNADPTTGAAGCDNATGTSGGINPRLVLTHTASPSTILINESTSLTASVLVDSGGAAVPLADVTTLIGLPLTFGNPAFGTLSGAGTVVGANGKATATFNAGATGGPGGADATVDSAVARASVEVHEPPEITVPADIAVDEDTPWGGTASVSWTTSATGYPVPTIACKDGGTTIASPHTFGGGVTTVECTAANGVSPDDTESFTVTVRTRPEITIPADITVTEDTPNGGTASVSWTTSATGYPAPTSGCSVGGTPVTSPRTFAAGTTTVDCTATNSLGSDTESFTVTVNTLPVITVPADITVAEDPAGSGTASVSWTTSATGTPTPTITCAIAGNTVTSPHTFPEGTTTVDCTATNSVGSDSDSFDVTVQTVPVLTVPADMTVTEDAPGGGTASVSWTTSATGHPAPTTTCKVGDTVVTSPHTFPAGTTTVTCTATNAAGSDTESFTVTVETLPVLTVPADIFVNEDTPGGGTASVSWTTSATGTPAPTTTCKIGGTTITSPHTFPAGVTTVTCTATNSVGSDTESFDVDVNQVPVADPGGSYTSPEGADVTFDATGSSDADGDALTVGWDLDNDGAFDDATGIAPTLTWAQLEALGIDDDVSERVIHVRVTDEGGASDSASTKLTVTNAPPVPSVTPASSEVGVDDPVGLTLGADDPSSADDAAGFDYTVDWGDGASETASGVGPRSVSHAYTAPGTYTVTVTAADDDGAAATTTALVKVRRPSLDEASAYWLAAADGGVFSFGGAPFLGSLADVDLNGPVVGLAATPSGQGYWLAASDGGVFTFGDAGFFGSMAGTLLNGPVVGIVPTSTGEGYWLVGADGGVFAFGDAGFFGSMGGVTLAAPVVDMVATDADDGYWLVGADGGVFTFGEADFLGSLGGTRLRSAITAVSATVAGDGYWLYGGDGGVFSFGAAADRGSLAGTRLVAPVVDAVATTSGLGYWLAAADGGVFDIGDAGFQGSMGGRPLAAPVAGLAVRPNR